MTKYKYRKYSKYSIENPNVWAILQDRDAKSETKILVKIIRKYRNFKSILDVGCGIGTHIYEYNKKGFKVKGTDADSAKIKFAKNRYPNLKFEIADMRNFKEKNRFDVITCIGSILVFNETNEEVMKTLNNFYNTLNKNGLLLIGLKNPLYLIEHCNFRKTFVDDQGDDRKKFGIKAVYEEGINCNRQTFISKRTFYRLKDNKKVGIHKKETRLFFPQELKFFIEQAGFEFVDYYAGISLKKDLNNSPNMLIVCKKK